MIRQGRDLGIEDDPEAMEQSSDYQHALLLAQEALGMEVYREAWSRGAAMSLEELVAEAAKKTREAAR